MDGAIWYKHFDESPEPVQRYLVGKQAMDDEAAAQKELAYDDDAWDRVMDVVWQTIFLHLSEEDFSARVSRLAGDRKPDEIERVVLLKLVLPLADVVMWDVERRLQELGVPIGEIQSVSRVALRPVSYGAAVRRIAAQAHLSLLSEEMVRRTRDILISYLKGVRLIEQVKEILQRNQSEGGIGFTREQAEVFAKAMEDFLNANQVISEQEYADWFTTAQREAQSKQIAERVQTSSTAPATDTDLPPSARPITSARSQVAITALSQTVETTVQQLGVGGSDPYVQKRLASIISTRLRDVRNAFQIKEVLTREVKVGGLGLAAPEVERIAAAIEAAYAQSHGQIADEEKRSIEQIQSEQGKKIEERRKRESEEHAQWFQDKVVASQKEETARQEMFTAMKKSSEKKSSELGARSSERQNENRMDSVEAPVRLIGLTEELSDLTLDSFRRLAKAPEQATAKIYQKLETLKQESFERWTGGVQSWRRSPLQRLYLQLVAQSFAAGKPVAALVEEKRATDPTIPTAEEIGAIMTLNTKIHL